MPIILDSPQPNPNGSGPSPKATASSPPERIGIPGILTILAVVGLMLVFPKVRHRLLVILPIVTLLQVIHLSGFYVAGLIAGARISEFSLLYGGAILRWRCGGTWFAVNWCPLGGYVRFEGQEEEMGTQEEPRPHVSERRWRDVNRFVRAAICLCGPIGILALAACLLGLEDAWNSVRRSPRQYYDLWLGGQSVQLMRRLLQLLDTGAFLQILGVLAVKQAFAHLLPFSFVNGGQALHTLMWSGGSPPRIVTIWNYASLFLALAAAVVTCNGLIRAW